MKRVFVCLILSLAVLLTLTGCMSEEERQSRKEALSVLRAIPVRIMPLSTGTTLENQTLYMRRRYRHPAGGHHRHPGIPGAGAGGAQRQPGHHQSVGGFYGDQRLGSGRLAGFV